MRTQLRVIVAALVVLTVTAASGATAATHACFHGESSMAVTLIDGRYVVTQPATTTGCTP